MKAKPPLDPSPWGSRLLIAAFVLAGAVMVVLVLHAIVVRPMIVRTIESYTDIEVRPVPPAAFTETETKALDDRVDTFLDDVKSARALEPLTLSAAELNALIQDGDKDPSDGTLFVRIRDGEIEADLSLPTDEFAVGPLDALKGRYLTGTAKLHLGISGDALDVRLLSFNVKGEPLPGWVINRLNGRSLAKAALDDPKARDVIRNLDRIDILDGKLVLVPKAPPSENTRR